MKTFLLEGDINGEHLRAEIHKDEVLIIGNYANQAKEDTDLRFSPLIPSFRERVHARISRVRWAEIARSL